ncbi:MAG TPA: right-handed parallel beta-helix repeat-containing protein [Acidimicrobiales bacterium]|nr:right-handed parallel beta-helix repeat-containing protein [Acidimicrobiales bacterium]
MAGSAIPGTVDLDAGVPGVSPPSTIADNCSVNVSATLQAWLSALAPGTLVRPPAGACYNVSSGMELKFPQGLTIDGGTFTNITTQDNFKGHWPGRPTFNIIGGSGVTFEDLTITGANPGGYHPALAFEAGIELQGTAHAVIRNVAIDHVYGDGITLAPLRGSSDHASSLILAATTDLTINTVDITGSGRQGISLASVNTAIISNVALKDIGIDTFDFEADEAKEGAKNVTIDGCTSSTWHGGLFFANAGSSDGPATSNITVENCRMLHPQGGDAILSHNIANADGPRGPITFSNDTLWCGASAYVGCVQLDRADVTITQSVILFPKYNLYREELYDAGSGSSLAFAGDSVQGWSNPLGQHRASSTVSVTGGSWQPIYNAASVHDVVTVSHTDTPQHVAERSAHAAAEARRDQRQATR